MKSCLGLILLLGYLSWPASADLADIEPIVQYALPADIMQVEFANETWVYRLYEDGTVKKVVSGRVVASRDEEVQEKTHLVELGSMFQAANPFFWAWSDDNTNLSTQTDSA